MFIPISISWSNMYFPLAFALQYMIFLLYMFHTFCWTFTNFIGECGSTLIVDRVSAQIQTYIKAAESLDNLRPYISWMFPIVFYDNITTNHFEAISLFNHGCLYDSLPNSHIIVFLNVIWHDSIHVWLSTDLPHFQYPKCDIVGSNNIVRLTPRIIIHLYMIWHDSIS